VIPLFVTAMIIPFLVVILGIFGNDGTSPKGTQDAAKAICAAMFSPMILLLLGGFSIAAALSKFHIAKRMATMILSRAGTKSNRILLAIMFIATFASMWLSNVAAPVLCYSVIQVCLLAFIILLTKAHSANAGARKQVCTIAGFGDRSGLYVMHSEAVSVLMSSKCRRNADAHFESAECICIDSHEFEACLAHMARYHDPYCHFE
jgi:di/tricarboxylate transporter